MRKIPNKMREEMANDSYYNTCSRLEDGGCGGRITWEHAVIFAGRQLNEKWAIIPMCERHHGVGTYQDGGILDKQRNLHIALNRATDQELEAISKSIDYKQLRDRLNIEHGS